MTNQNKETVIEFLSKSIIDIDFRYFLEGEDFETVEDISDILDNKDAFNIEIIYYSTAIEYLMKNDDSLRESLEIASDMGFETKNLNSEILASLLASQNVRDEFSEIEREIEELIESFEEEETEEEAL